MVLSYQTHTKLGNYVSHTEIFLKTRKMPRGCQKQYKMSQIRFPLLFKMPLLLLLLVFTKITHMI